MNLKINKSEKLILLMVCGHFKYKTPHIRKPLKFKKHTKQLNVIFNKLLSLK
jgi:hypothetical protein